MQPPDRPDERISAQRGSTLEAPERVVVLPEADQRPGARGRPSLPAQILEDDDTRTWALVTVVALALVVVCFVLALPGQERTPVRVPTVHPLPANGPGALLGIPVGKHLRTHTVDAAGDQDVLLLAKGGPSAIAPLIGAPVTADGVILRETYDGNAFMVRSHRGEKMIVYVPYQGPTDIAHTLTPQRRVTFEGTLMPAPDDFASMVGVDAAAIASRTGAYLVAVPESLHPVRHLNRS